MSSRNDGSSRIIIRRAFHLYIQFLLNAFLQVNAYTFFVDKLLTFFQCRRRKVAKYFQLIFRLTDKGA